MSETVDLINISRSVASAEFLTPNSQKSVGENNSTDNTPSSKEIKRALNQAYADIRRLKKEAHKNQHFSKPLGDGKHTSKAKATGSSSKVPEIIDVKSDDVYINCDDTLSQSQTVSIEEDTGLSLVPTKRQSRARVSVESHIKGKISDLQVPVEPICDLLASFAAFDGVSNNDVVKSDGIDDDEFQALADGFVDSMFRDIEDAPEKCAIFYRTRSRTLATWIYDECIFKTLARFSIIPDEIQRAEFFNLHNGHYTQTKFLSLFTVSNTSSFSNEWLCHNSYTHYRMVDYDRRIFDEMVRDYCGHIPTPDLHSNMLSKFLQLNENVAIELIQTTADVAYQYIDFSAFRAACVYGVTKSRVPRMTYT